MQPGPQPIFLPTRPYKSHVLCQSEPTSQDTQRSVAPIRSTGGLKRETCLLSVHFWSLQMFTFIPEESLVVLSPLGSQHNNTTDAEYIH